jgi:hypothetical protein
MDEKNCQTMIKQQHALKYFGTKIIATKFKKLGFWWQNNKKTSKRELEIIKHV